MTIAVSRALTRLSAGRAAGIDVLALPHSGAAATAFAGLAAALGDRAVTYGVTLPGRGPRSSEPMPTDWVGEVEALAADVAATLDPSRPLVVVGQSLGAVLGYDLVGRLATRGRRVAHLVAVARSAPHLGGPLALPAGDADLADLVAKRYGSIPAAVLAEPELLRYFVPVLRADLVFNGSYRHEATVPLDVPITAMIGADDRTIPLPALHAWREHTSARFEALVVPGPHLCLAGNEHVVAGCVAAAADLHAV